MAIRKSASSGIPSGVSAGRPANPSYGQLYANGETARLEIYTQASGWQNIVQEVPGVSSATGHYYESDNTGTFTVTGTNFVSGAVAYAIGTNGTEYQADTTTYISAVQLTATFTSLSANYEPYDIKIVNPSNMFGILPDAFSINDSPVWSTSSGSLGSYSQGSVSIQLAATDDESNSITYSILSGSLPTGLSMSSGGLISGSMTASSETYTFTVSATDGLNAAVTRSFSITAFPTITGGTISVSGLYRIHTFTGNGTFSTDASSLSTEYMVIAGGGGGGGGLGGGGGAGGYLAGTSSLSSNSYSIVVGGGGAGGVVSPSEQNGTNGVNTTAFNLTTIGGGGGARESANGVSGGSGGGGSHTQSASYVGGSGTSGQGNAGGTGGGSNGENYPSGGGGGSGATGGNFASGRAGHGGAGTLNAINGSSLYWAAGGGGSIYTGGWSAGNGGIGGGGGGSADNGVAGTGGGSALNSGGNGGTGSTNGGAGGTNTGSGGGGSSNASLGGNGGSGIVIVRYLKSVVGL